MATKHVNESLMEFQNYLYSYISEGKKEKESDEDKKLKDAEIKNGMSAIKKLRNNLSKFEKSTGGKIIKYKEFWEENQNVSSEFDDDGNIYKLWNSNYIVGVLSLPDEALSDDELNAEIEIVDQEGGDDNDADTDDEEYIDDEDDEDEDDEDEDDEDELDEGNAFSGAVKKAKDKNKKDFKFKGKKFPVKESALKGENFDINKKDDNSLDESFIIERYKKLFESKDDEEDDESDTDEFSGFDPETLDDVDNDKTDSDDKDDSDDNEDVDISDDETIEVDDTDMSDYDDNSEFEDDDAEDNELDFSNEDEPKKCFVIYNIKGTNRDEVFRTSEPEVIEEFNNFYENEFKAAIKAQIQTFKQAHEEKIANAEAKTKEELMKKRKSKLDKFLKESSHKWEIAHQNEEFDRDHYDDEMSSNADFDMNDENDKPEESDDFDTWKENLIDILSKDYDLDEYEAIRLVDETDLDEAYEYKINIADIAADIYDKYENE